MAAAALWVVPLAGVDHHDLPLVGGKAANLGELCRARFPVPKGFVITTEAYRRTLAAAGVPPVGSAPGAEAGDPARLARLIAEVPLLAAVEAAVVSAYRELGEGPVAVRSSATTEDLPGATFAGQQESFLNVIGTHDLLGAVRRCWASLWGDRAVAYRRRVGADSDPAIAVVVQQMVPVEVAGVLFTANPVTGVRDELVIEASPGLGEAVVSGLVTPEHIVLDRLGRIRGRRAGRHEVVITGRDSGGVTHGPAAGAGGEALADAPARELAGLGVRISELFGCPQDIEWAYADGSMWIVQARPLTALPPAPVKVGLPRRTAAAVCAELLPVRPFPLDMTAWTMPAWFGILVRMARELPAIHVSVGEMLPERRGVVTELVPPHLRPTLRTLTTLLRLRSRLRYDPARWTSDPRFTSFERTVTALQGSDLSACSWTALMGVPREVLETLDAFVDLRIDYLPSVAASLLRLRAWLWMFGALEEFWPLVSGQDTRTRAANDELQAIASRIRRHPVWGPELDRLASGEFLARLQHDDGFTALRADVENWLRSFGHRETTSPALISSPTWAEAPGMLLDSLRGLAAQPAAAPGPPEAAASEERVHSRWLVAATQSQRRVAAAATAARTGIGFREDSHFHALRLRPVMRRALLEAGDRLARASVLAVQEDVFHLKLDELRNVDDPFTLDQSERQRLAQLVADRKLARAEFGEAPLISPATLHPGLLRPSSDALVSGTPGGGGRATGPVRIIRDPSEFGLLRRGDVLVCPYTNPSWTPLFQLAAAVVADAGSFASHAAIVAREYGIPAVMGTGNGTSALADGQLVVVDGTRGDVVAATGNDRNG